MTIPLQFAVDFGFILLASDQQNKTACSIGLIGEPGFKSTRAAIILMRFALLVVFSLAFWRWMGCHYQ